MGLISGLLKTVIDVAVLPVSIISDSLTLGGSLTDGESAVKNNLEKLIEDIESIDD